MKKVLAIVIIFFVGVVFGLIMAHGQLNAQSANSDSDVMSKLSEIAKGQNELMDTIKSMKDDINIIKVRVTQMQ